MIFDWFTWSVWLLGFLILVVWIIVPLKEFRKLLAERNKKSADS
jgi:heme exporter protein D